MGLFDKLKKLVSDDSSDTGGIEILPAVRRNRPIEDVPDVVFAEKIVGDGIAIAGRQQDGCSVRRHHRQNLRDQPCVLESDSGIELFVHFWYRHRRAGR